MGIGLWAVRLPNALVVHRTSPFLGFQQGGGFVVQAANSDLGRVPVLAGPMNLGFASPPVQALPRGQGMRAKKPLNLGGIRALAP